MRFLRTLSKILILFPIIVAGYDFIDGWFVHASLKLQPTRVWADMITGGGSSMLQSMLQSVFGPNFTNTIMSSPCALVLVVPPVACYLIYRIWFMIKGGHGAGGFVYKSHD